VLYLDASALVKRYVEEDGSTLVRTAMAEDDAWFSCRVGFVETARAVGLVGGRSALTAFRREWSAVSVVEVDAPLAEHAAELTRSEDLRSLDALHLAAALLLPPERVTVATWDRRLHAAVRRRGVPVLPGAIA
jgi:predicted nucleic acid-binding protein